MSSNEIYDELFALRIGLQDIYFNEQDIIRELKVFLVNKNIEPENMDQLILDFYKKYDINFPIEFISEVTLPIFNLAPIQAVGNEALRNLLISHLLNDLLIDNYDEELLDDEDSDDEMGDHSSDNDADLLNQQLDSDDEMGQQPPQDSQVNNNPNNLSFLPFPQILPNDNFTHGITQGITISYGTSNYPFSTFSIPTTTSSQPVDSSNISDDAEQQPNIDPFPVSFQSLLNNNLQQLMSPFRLNNMEDVKVTLDDNELVNLPERKLEENLDQKCSVCMMDLLKDQEVCEVKCKHVFHSSCIKQWLKEYSYKCPVCREECGTPKYHT